MEGKPLKNEHKSRGTRPNTPGGFGDINASMVVPPRSSNIGKRQNLNTTLSSAAPSFIKPTINPVENVGDLVYHIAYNDYLQTLIKQQSVKKTIEEHEVKVNDQMLLQLEHFHKLETTLNDILDQIKSLKEQSDIARLLETLKVREQEVESLCSTYNMYNQLNELNQILVKESDFVSVKNIKPVNSQEEYDKFLSSLYTLMVVLEKISGGLRFKEVNELASSMRIINDLNNRIQDAIQKLTRSNRETGVLILKQSSDYFAQKGGYF